MLDTVPEIKQKQLEIVLSKSPQERFIIGAEMIDFGRGLVMSSIKQLNPGISDLDLKIAVFRRCYSGALKSDDLEKIVESLTDFESRK